MAAPSLPKPVADDWILLPVVFQKLTDSTGHPEIALQDIHRALLCGAVRSLRRRTLNDAGVNDAELARTFWRDIELLPACDERGRDIIRLCLAEGIKPSVDTRSDPRFGIFYLHRANCIKAWPELAPIEPKVSPKISRHADIIIREEIAKAYEQTPASKKPPNINELLDLVQPRVHERGHKVPRKRIKEIAQEEFKDQRLKSGKRWR
jgi:hypothetical protein